jgi:hypothetical protein
MNMSESIPPVQPVTVTPVPAANSTRSWEVLCHLSSLLGLFFGFIWIPFLNILAPLIVWLVKKGDSAGVDAHGKESINFHLSWTLYAAVSLVLLFASIIGIILIPFWIIGVYIEIALMMILTIVAAVKASNGVLYRYPLTIRFLK